MQSTSVPAKFPIPFAKNAGGGFIRTVPQATQIGIQDGAASLNDGFPPLCFTPPSAGGKWPFGQDFNGILNQITSWDQWVQAGAPIIYDSSFQTSIGGYPKGAVIQSATTLMLFWMSIVENNLTNPDTGGAGWVSLSNVLGGPATGAQLQFTNATTLTIAPKAGGYLWINGVNYPIPANLTVSNAGLLANTLYRIYGFASGGQVAAEINTTGYVLGANGIPQKSGDPTRTLIGMAMLNASAQFADQDGFRWVASYFNRRRRSSQTTMNTVINFTQLATFAEVSSAARNFVLVWGDTGRIDYAINAVPALCDSVGAGGADYGASLDGGGPLGGVQAGNSPSGFPSGYIVPFTVPGAVAAAEGSHYITCVGTNNTNTFSSFNGATATNGGNITVFVWVEI